jgi:hypothetical protein
MHTMTVARAAKIRDRFLAGAGPAAFAECHREPRPYICPHLPLQQALDGSPRSARSALLN